MTDDKHERDDDLERVVKACSRVTPRPYKVRIVLGDGGADRDVKISGNAKSRPWSKLRKLLSVLDWVRIEAMDSRNNLIEAWENEGDEADDESLDNEPRVIALAVKFQRLMLEGQEVVLNRQTKHLEAMLTGTLRALEVVTRSAESMSALFEQRLKMVQAMANATPEGDGGLMSGGMIDALIAQKLGLAPDYSKQPAPAAPAQKNGQRKG